MNLLLLATGIVATSIEFTNTLVSKNLTLEPTLYSLELLTNSGNCPSSTSFLHYDSQTFIFESNKSNSTVMIVLKGTPKSNQLSISFLNQSCSIQILSASLNQICDSPNCYTPETLNIINWFSAGSLVVAILFSLLFCKRRSAIPLVEDKEVDKLSSYSSMKEGSIHSFSPSLKPCRVMHLPDVYYPGMTLKLI